MGNQFVPLCVWSSSLLLAHVAGCVCTTNEHDNALRSLIRQISANRSRHPIGFQQLFKAKFQRHFGVT